MRRRVSTALAAAIMQRNALTEKKAPNRLRRLTSISSIEIGSLVDSLRSGACSINPVFFADDLIEIKLHEFAVRRGRFAVDYRP